MFIYQKSNNDICWFKAEGNMRHYSVYLILNNILPSNLWKSEPNVLLCGFYNDRKYNFIKSENYHLVIDKNIIEVVYKKYSFIPYHLRPDNEILNSITDEQFKIYFNKTYPLIDEYLDVIHEEYNEYVMDEWNKHLNNNLYDLDEYELEYQESEDDYKEIVDAICEVCNNYYNECEICNLCINCDLCSNCDDYVYSCINCNKLKYECFC